MELSTRYSPQDTESKWYGYWEAKKYFHSEPDDREAFTIVIPPPNVTGVLHMGHMLNNTIQDILIRKARMEGKNACWVPGTDHASIATEAKVVRLLREKGIKKGDLTREEFLAHAFEWKDKYGGIILDQLKKLGASCDWDRTRFTMEASLSNAVLKTFVDLYKKGKIYRGLRMTNWDPVALTVLSNEEVIYKEENATLFHLRYRLEEDPTQFIVIATQRPETIMADAAVAVHPEDPRYTHLIGKKVLIPLINKAIPVIADDYVDIEFGTGALKVTPAHDLNDNEIGERHGLEVVDLLTADGRLNENAQILIGEDRFDARKKIKKLLEEAEALVELENYRTNIGRSERTDAVVEPRLTLQWFMEMKGMAKQALDAVEKGDIKFHPGHFWNMYYNWLREDNVKDWCISRQLWWGQQIPAWYIGEEVIVAETAEEALTQARSLTGNAALQMEDLTRDEDVVDTWFSSWLWPMSVFDGFERQDELKYYYPTNVLVTGWDIIFFWVARMVMAGYEWAPELLGAGFEKGIMPFKEVYFTGMVRDAKRRKMSKSLGNSPDALVLMDTYGADGVRFGMLSSTSAGNDIIFDAPFDPETGEIVNESKLCEQGRNFCNKIWNALRLIKGWEVDTNLTPSPVNAFATAWLTQKMQSVIVEVQQHFDDYRLSDAMMTLYGFIWDDFCSWYLEMIKPTDGKMEADTYEKTLLLMEDMMVALHPFMPFVTEEIYHQLRDRKPGDDCVIRAYPTVGAYDKAWLAKAENAKELVSKIREVRASNSLKMKDAYDMFMVQSASAKSIFEVEGMDAMVAKLGNLSQVTWVDDSHIGGIGFLSGTDKYFLMAESTIDVEEEKDKIAKELERLLSFIGGINKKLSNERFVNNAPEEVVALERKKVSDSEDRIRILEENLKALG